MGITGGGAEILHDESTLFVSRNQKRGYISTNWSASDLYGAYRSNLTFYVQLMSLKRSVKNQQIRASNFKSSKEHQEPAPADVMQPKSPLTRLGREQLISLI
ncbi:hypothetical protein RRG08_029324 [Elysia crispata]|uniref:Uncharacterized protein n=1 Tax=Elysia crispata TaxID=231223 RepID=A0AAE1ASX4_9GAST|nr:hypothetical protein RRG08_029324 [Elysia crispata]